MRVLFTTTPGWGHVHPMVPLARAFLDQGDEVLWAAAAPVCARLERDGFAAVPAGQDEVEHMREFHHVSPEFEELSPAARPDFMFPRLFGIVRAGPMLTDLLPVSQQWQPSLVIHDAAELAAPIAAALLGVPNVTHAFGALLPAARVAAAGAVVAPLWEAQGLTPRPYGGCYDHLYLDIYPPSLQTEDRSHVPAVQPLRPVTFASSGGEELPDLVTHASPDPLLYVTFGTVFNKDLGLVRTVIEAVRDLPVRVIVTLGPQGDPDQLGPQPGNVQVTRYIPQGDLLWRCSAVISHAGSGTFLAGLAQALPQLCLPQAADQFLNAAACERAGAGISLQPGMVTVDRAREAVEQLLSNADYRSAAHRLSREIAAMPAPEEVAEMLHRRFERVGDAGAASASSIDAASRSPFRDSVPRR